MPTDINSFDPLLFELFRQASLKEHRLPFATYAIAVRQRMRMYQLRNAMRKTEHALRLVAEQVQLSIVNSDGRTMKPNDKGIATLVIRPSDNELVQALRAQGFKPPEPDEVGAPTASDYIDSLMED